MSPAVVHLLPGTFKVFVEQYFALASDLRRPILYNNTQRLAQTRKAVLQSLARDHKHDGCFLVNGGANTTVRTGKKRCVLKCSADGATAAISMIFKNLIATINATIFTELHEVLGTATLREKLQGFVNASGCNQSVGGSNSGHDALHSALHLAKVHSSNAKFRGMLLCQCDEDCNVSGVIFVKLFRMKALKASFLVTPPPPTATGFCIGSPHRTMIR